MSYNIKTQMQMKNKYYLANKREARLTSLNTWIMNDFTAPLRFHKVIIKLVKRLINRKNNLKYGVKPV